MGLSPVKHLFSLSFLSGFPSVARWLLNRLSGKSRCLLSKWPVLNTGLKRKTEADAVPETKTLMSNTGIAREINKPVAKPAGYGLVFFIWMLIAAGLAYLSSGQADFYPQLYLSGGLLALMFFFKRFDSKKRIPRVFFLGIATFIVLRYFFWRTLYTIEFTDWVSFSCALILYIGELYGMAIFMVGNFVNVSPITRKPAPILSEEDAPTVDVFIPSYNESPELLEMTAAAALQMRYPKDKLKVYICDDGGTDQKCNKGTEESMASAKQRRQDLMALCETLGAHYLTRPRNVHAKAGNLNEGMQKTNGDLVVIFDADHVPTEDFLEKTVGYFSEDAKLFLVQTPHFFINPDPIEKNLETFGHMPSENEMFYRGVQRGLDFWNAAFFCGSAAVMRRSLLDKVGGIAGETITEDAETALGLHARGYNSLYVETPLISGLQPETIGGFMKQRQRWAQGMAQIFLLKCPLLLKGLSIPQRLCYFNSCFFWFFPFSRMMYLVAPCAFLFFGLRIYAANWQTFCSYVIPYMISVLSVSHYLHGKVRWAFVSELYEMIQSVSNFPALIAVLLKPRAPSFAVTSKGEVLDKDFISPYSTPFYLLTLFNLGIVGFGIYRLCGATESTMIYPIAITLFWALFNTVLLLASIGALFERRQLRTQPRMASDIAAEIQFGDGTEKALPCKIADLSMGGCKLAVKSINEKFFNQYSEGVVTTKLGKDQTEQRFHVEFRNIRDSHGPDGIFVGAEFKPRDLAERMARVRLVAGDSRRWKDFQSSRDSKLGVFSAFMVLTFMGLKYATRHLMHMLGEAGGTVTGKVAPQAN